MLMGRMAYYINKLSIFLSYKYTRQTNLVYDTYNEINVLKSKYIVHFILSYFDM